MKKLAEQVDSLRKQFLGLPGKDAVSWDSFAGMAAQLVDTGFLTPGWTLTRKGALALDAGPGGVLLAELLTRLADKDTFIPHPGVLAGWAAGCLCERVEDRGKRAGIGVCEREAVDFLADHGIDKLYSDEMAKALADWADGKTLDRCATLMGAGPGDFVLLARRAAEALRGVAGSAAGAGEMAKVARRDYEFIWRGEVAEVF